MNIAEYKDRSAPLRAIGCILLCAGVFLVCLGPLEMICFPMFWSGGKFHYEGFGFGSFMFGVIAAQIIAYPAAGAVLIPLGWGHLRLRRWAHKLSLSLLWAWLAAGAPVVAAAAFIAVGTKDMTPVSAIITFALLALIWPLLPMLLIRLYGSDSMKSTFEIRDSKTYWTDRLPVPALALCVLCSFCILVQIICVFYSGVFPLFGAILTGTSGFAAITICISLLILLIWGLIRLKRGAWYGASALLFLLLASTLITYSLHSYQDILSALSFPQTENDALANLPLQGYHLALLMSFPYAGGFIAAIISGRHFKQ